MYSFYRAWLMRDAVSATLATPPDVLITVGGMHSASKYHQFAAHRHVVSAHSGYLKALLATTPGHSVSLPNVGPEAFGPLLTYMYTGYLDVNVENIYSILLATHLLHMPRALDQCRSFLVQNQQSGLPTLHPVNPGPEELSGNFLMHNSTPSEAPDKRAEDLPTLVKPIPSRKMLPVLFNLNSGLPGPVTPVNGNFWPHLPYPLPPPPTVVSSNHSPFKSVLPPSLPDVHDPGLHYPSPVVKQRETYPTDEGTKTPVKTPSRKRPRSPLAIPSTSTSRKTVLLRVPSPIRSSSISPCLSNNSSDSEELNVNLSSEEKQHHSKAENKKLGKSSSTKKSEHIVENICNTGEKGKVIIDVACCDGPVRFHRVLNDNYGFAVDEIVVENSRDSASGGITTTHKDIAIRRTTQSNLIPKKIVKLSVITTGKTDNIVENNSPMECIPERQEHNSDNLIDSTPHTTDSTPHTRDSTPHTRDSTPHTRDSTPHTRDSMPHTSREEAPCTSNEIISDSHQGDRGKEPVPNSVHCSSTNPETIRHGDMESTTSYQQIGELINVETSDKFDNNSVQSESYSTHTNHSTSSQTSHSQDDSVVYTQATTSINPSKAPPSSSPNKPGSDNIYTCVYCNHTFKSHYCYQKHARRHINPVTLDMNNLVDRLSTKASCAQVSKAPDKTPGVRREVRLLDMNVQYYPCKTCGSKFPSYYFVHKHRKMCHADETDDMTGSEESQTHSQSTTINSV